MKTYIVVVSDRHCDDELLPFRAKASAMKCAAERTKCGREHYRVSKEEVERDLTNSMVRDGWLFYAALEDAFSVHVEQREIKP